MRKCMALCMVLALLLCGCDTPGDPLDNSLHFYYPVNSMDYTLGSAYIRAESREGAEYKDDLEKILNLYLQGPVDKNSFTSPFQYNTRIEAVSMDSQILDITLSRGFATYTGLKLTVACACITMTCLELTGAEAVRIRAKDTTLDGAEYIEMNAASVLLVDLGGETQE